MRSKAREISHNQPGNPDKLAEVVIAFVDAKDPPVRLPLGSDTVAAIEAKHVSDRELLAQWREVSISTDFQQAQ
ncbi:short chain dehydrogenase [compost metagenome]